MQHATAKRRHCQNHSKNFSTTHPKGWYIIIVKVTHGIYHDYYKDHEEKLLGIERTRLAGTRTVTYTVYVTAQEMGRLKVNDRVSIKRGGIFSNKYYLKGNPNCSFFCDTITGVVASK